MIVENYIQHLIKCMLTYKLNNETVKIQQIMQIKNSFI